MVEQIDVGTDEGEPAIRGIRIRASRMRRLCEISYVCARTFAIAARGGGAHSGKA
jgi:hypothetical protein